MMIRKVLTIAGAALLSATQSAMAQVEAECSQATSRDSARVYGILSAPPKGILAEQGLDSARVEQVQALSGPLDGAICHALRRAVEQDRADQGIAPSAHLSYFKSGPLYFVAYSNRDAWGANPVVIDGDDGRVYVVGRDFRVRVRVRA